ncbi:DgyrCDS8172 [Dimorphilus gyrociliatus]|uniref:non-specific serine/threonine protein kinase n=1 Tax=Dimorphilus gyrociliatus TaxID=2664684 RepID=A0A7I8VVM5_9ANNE|nr:DgyrCDS8172 [Dimorphilus gyrociliatus]
MWQLLKRLSMGCICGKETIYVDNRKFYIRSHLAEGGFSRIDLIEDDNSNLFALKRINCHNVKDEEIAAKEIDFMKRVKHERIISLECSELVPFKGYQGPNSPQSEALLVMPFYRRGTLFDHVLRIRKRGEFLGEVEVLSLFEQICEGVCALHTLNPSVAHRDLKPHNVLLTDEEEAILMDLGSAALSRPVIDNSRQALVIQDEVNERCSMPYRPPELFNVQIGSGISEKTDIWSLGCTLYAICCGESPFDETYCKGDSIALAVLAGRIKFPTDWPYSDGLKRLINDMLHINAEDRPDIHVVILQISSMLRALENRV